MAPRMGCYSIMEICKSILYSFRALKKRSIMLLIGDVHGKIDSYWKILQTPEYQNEKSIQLGDFGFKKQHMWHIRNVDNSRHKVLFGNHDDYSFVNCNHSLGHYGVYEDIFFIRGAFSIDRAYRMDGIDWWPEEEMSWKDWNSCIDLFQKVKPRIVISHDCPAVARKEMWKIYDKSITSEGLQACLEMHQPDKWFYGHHHYSKTSIIENVSFQCLAELEVVQI